MGEVPGRSRGLELCRTDGFELCSCRAVNCDVGVKVDVHVACAHLQQKVKSLCLMC